MSFSFPCLFIQGPTATGKSQLGLSVAGELGGCIVNADSIQLYEGLKIGSAAPSPEDLKQADHFLFQVIAKGENWTASQYEEAAWKKISEELKRRAVIVVGGSGFYFRALEFGMGDSKAEDLEIKNLLERELKEKGSLPLHQELSQADPVSARKIHPNDHYRLLRALGYFRTYRRPFSEDQKLTQKRVWPGALIKVGLTASQSELRPLMEQRVRRMLKDGLVEEVRGLLREGLSAWPPLQSVGYREVILFLEGKLQEEELVAEITQKTLALAKRQKTWFQRDKEVKWFSPREKDLALRWIKDRLS
jgi:tRNA dimethylallyltransferase